MSNAINNVGNSTPFDRDMGNLPAAAQNGMQTEASFSSVRMFSPDNTGDMGAPQAAGGGSHVHHAHHAAANDDGIGTQGAPAAAQGGGADKGNAMGQFMDMLKTALSSVMQLLSPLLGMATSMMGSAMGGAGTTGGGAA
jgi:hypothetical protein